MFTRSFSVLSSSKDFFIDYPLALSIETKYKNTIYKRQKNKKIKKLKKIKKR